jgi:hypothetical protein
MKRTNYSLRRTGMQILHQPAIAEQLEVTNWAALRAEDLVAVRHGSGQKQTAIVDDVSTKGEVVWIRDAEMAERKLVHRSDAVRIYCEPARYEYARIAVLVQSLDIDA